ncbi:glycogen debranching protein [Ameyamaea chiangmaiensis NBRC 103196]|uniref:Glycogen debranching protein GlgX n=1 Tax=Ameyamaea chiangmaiensis TaxID=442969 RepID=A0A850P720_9PROT|nr:glycogen debranching protein GlgX [Ameyamaea chiangmaiensis]MBS4074690.1 glycogen debranching protein GlgX [Ameyamaea chiangmaiensis]NVN40407.1 glycogen debranching protein GlgX [Ameyamaea chiangmaiensis]GBQ62376.1 glycogen debranching protein [Ameyamaea chiangmaiensis NBRC 103196]
MQRLPDRLSPGIPSPLGANWDGMGVNFAVFSANAQKIELCIFDPAGRREVARLALPDYTDEVWHGYLPDARPGLLYGFRAHGPYDPVRGHRFNPAKLLLDPYARATSGALNWSDSLFGYRLNSARSDLTLDKRDSAAAMPKCVVTSEGFNWGNDRRPQVPWEQTVIMEGHVKGLTMRSTDLHTPERGSFQGLSDPRLIDHLLTLGITSLELMPVHGFVRDRFLLERGLTNYWGYNTLTFFAPHASYIASGTPDEFRLAIRRLHAAGIEVILDVVYNHTAEGSELGPTLCHRGLDNASYYRLVPGDERHNINDTGCGNTLNLSHPRVMQMVLDSLRYWASSFHVDGFRFDLCATLGRESYGFDPNCSFFSALLQDPLLSTLKLIAEPWDPGPGGYQTGNHPPGFAEWNDRYRDTVRRFWRGDPLQRGDLAARLAGSSDLFGRRGRRPWSSVNFVTSHDGFTLRDVVSYNERHNEANGENNQDGHSDNLSNNWGAEGPTDDPGIRETRLRVTRSMLATLLFSHGTPMLLAGDQFGQTQDGNNNAYCQDSAMTWLDWKRAASPEGRALSAFVGRLTALRRKHPSLRSRSFLHGQQTPVPDVPDMGWFGPDGAPMTTEAWNDGDGRVLGVRRVVLNEHGLPDMTYCLFNPASEDVPCRLPDQADGWRLLADTTAPDSDHSSDAVASDYVLGAHGTALFVAIHAEPDPEPGDG